jgi:exonuclease VII small subunit
MAPKSTNETGPATEHPAQLEEIECPISAAGEHCGYCDDPEDEEWEHSSARGRQAIEACQRGESMLHAIYGDLQKVHNRLLGIVSKAETEDDNAVLYEVILLVRRSHTRLKDVRQDLKDAIAAPASNP